jgi:N-acetyl sugar amidotransferase
MKFPQIKFCSLCTYTNTKPLSEIEFTYKKGNYKKFISFNPKNDICAACSLSENQKKIDWKSRETKLLKLLDKYRGKKGNTEYDCIVPGSGGKDSVFTSHILKYKYGMNPLTITFAPHLYTDWGKKNFYAWLESGFDNLLKTPNIRTMRLLTRLSFENILNPFQPFMMGQMLYPPKIAAKLDIPLVFYGENPVNYGNDNKENSSQKKIEKFSSKHKEIFMAGFNRKKLNDFGLSNTDLEVCTPMSFATAVKKKINIQYLGYYLDWHPQSNYYYATEKCGFLPAPERSPGTYSKYSSIDDKMDDIHYYTTYIKFGMGRATYDSAQEIRGGDLTRNEGIQLVKKYDGEYPIRFENEIFRYLSLDNDQFLKATKYIKKPVMDRKLFHEICNKFRPKNIWKIDKISKLYKLKNTIYS